MSNDAHCNFDIHHLYASDIKNVIQQITDIGLVTIVSPLPNSYWTPAWKIRVEDNNKNAYGITVFLTEFQTANSIDFWITNDILYIQHRCCQWAENEPSIEACIDYVHILENEFKQSFKDYTDDFKQEMKQLPLLCDNCLIKQ